MEIIRIYELSNYMLIAVILVSSSNGSKGKFSFFVVQHITLVNVQFFSYSFHNYMFISLLFYLYNLSH